ncbi:MAG: lactate utilization protein [Segetibacter sp.]|jgi:L-lactate dehydrogenase complex protein LldG|nr:lactate utilization protein [Segetibacter sp.]
MDHHTSSNNRYTSLGAGDSKERILALVKQNQPDFTDLPAIVNFKQEYDDVAEKFITVLRGIGSLVYVVEGYDQIAGIIKENFADARRIVSTCDELASIAEINKMYEDPHLLEDVDLFITSSNLAVAENGAAWITDKQLSERVLPFIAQEIALVINKKNIVETMHDAYDKIADEEYGFAVFIAGPSKTADIEQSLVLGAHGPKMMTVFVVE